MNTEKNSNTFNILLGSYENVLTSIEQVSRGFKSLLADFNGEDIVAKNGYDLDNLAQLRERGQSELLRIAFTGEFSSGKSFLISALSRRVQWTRNQGSDQYKTLLPTSPRPTSSCPVVVEPTMSGQNDSFNVLFEDSEEWEEKPLSDERVVNAYLTDLTPSSKRIVELAKFSINSAMRKAQLYDLPGLNSINVNYKKVVNKILHQSDCIIYVSAASKTLSETELKLLGEVYSHHTQTQKPVFFILTKIDCSNDFDSVSGTLAWEDIRDANNTFLKQNFLKNGKIDTDFIGEGFMCISAALEVKGKSLIHKSQRDASEMIDRSGMPSLRQKLSNYLENVTGPLHLSRLSVEAHQILLNLHRDIGGRYEAEKTPIEEIESKIKDYKTRKDSLRHEKIKLQETLRRLGDAAITRAFQGSDPDHLERFFNENLKQVIQEKDVLNEKEFNQILTKRGHLIQDWINLDKDKSLGPKWRDAYLSFIGDINDTMIELLGKSRGINTKTHADEDNNFISFSDMSEEKITDLSPLKYESTNGKTFKNAVDLMIKTSGKYLAITGVGAVSVSQIAVFLSLGGPAVTLGAILTGSVGICYATAKTINDRNERREHMVREFGDDARKIINAYRTQAYEIINNRIGLAIEVIDREIESLSNSIESFEQRLTTGEYQNITQRLKVMNDLQQQCGKISLHITEFYHEIAKHSN